MRDTNPSPDSGLPIYSNVEINDPPDPEYLLEGHWPRGSEGSASSMARQRKLALGWLKFLRHIERQRLLDAGEAVVRIFRDDPAG